jgi:flagellar motor switch/type III secretory pathway protein FliN
MMAANGSQSENGRGTETAVQSGAGAPSPVPAGSGSAALVVAATPAPEEAEPPRLDPRLDRLLMQLNVMVRVHGMRVRDLLALEKGTVVESVHEHTQDVPVECGGALLLWGEFEVLDQKLAVRITRLA